MPEKLTLQDILEGREESTKMTIEDILKSPQKLVPETSMIGKVGQVGEGFFRSAATFPARAAETVLGLTEQRGAIQPEVAAGIREPIQKFKQEVGPRQTPEQQLGADIEQISEFLVPGAIGTKAARLTPKVPRLAQGLTEAVTSAGIAGTQEDASEIGAFGAGLLSPFITPALQRLAKSFRRGAEKTTGQLLAPTKKPLKKLAEEKTIPGFLDRRIITRDLNILRDKAKEMSLAKGAQIDEFLDSAPETVQPQMRNVFKSLSDAKTQTRFRSDRFIEDVEMYQSINQIEDRLIGLYERHGGNLTPADFVEQRRFFEKLIKRRRGEIGTTAVFQDTQFNPQIDALKLGANAIRKELARSSPELSVLNAEYSFWRGLGDILDETVTRQTGQRGTGLIGTIGGAAGLGAGGSAGMLSGGFGGAAAGAGGGVIIGALAAQKLFQAFRSPLWRSVSANAKNKLASMLAGGRFNAAADLSLQLTGASLPVTLEQEGQIQIRPSAQQIDQPGNQ